MVAAFGFWAEENGDWIDIHLTCDYSNFANTTVTNNKNSERYHRTLFRNLRRLLISEGKWPYGDKGKETEVK